MIEVNVFMEWFVYVVATLLFSGFAIASLWQLFLFCTNSYNRWSSLISSILFAGVAAATWWQLKQPILTFVSIIRTALL